MSVLEQPILKKSSMFKTDGQVPRSNSIRPNAIQGKKSLSEKMVRVVNDVEMAELLETEPKISLELATMV